jgi:putative transposase
MPYTINPNMPRVRRDAVRLLREGWSARKVGRYLGFHHTAILEWKKKSLIFGDGHIPTRSSEPKTFRKPTSKDIEERIVRMRKETGRCALAIYLELKREGIKVGKNTVHRIIDRAKLVKKKSPWKRYHPHVDRPKALKQGDLVQMDTIHLMTGPKTRIYVFTTIDVYSRRAHAKAYEKMSGRISLNFLREAERSMFQFSMLQSDHGPEFGNWFVTQALKSHRYTRIGRPNDNAHIERFNRTIQEECLDFVPRNVWKINRALKKYLAYYNNQRLHLGINMYPREMV